MTAHVALGPRTGPHPRVLCDDCHLDEEHPKLQPAQDAARRHNLDQHAYPEHTLEIPEDTP